MTLNAKQRAPRGMAGERVDESWAVTLVLLGLAFAVAVAVMGWVAWVAIRFVIGG